MSTVGSKKGGNMVATVHTIPMGMEMGMRLMQEKGKLEEFIKLNTL